MHRLHSLLASSTPRPSALPRPARPTPRACVSRAPRACVPRPHTPEPRLCPAQRLRARLRLAPAYSPAQRPPAARVPRAQRLRPPTVRSAVSWAWLGTVSQIQFSLALFSYHNAVRLYCNTHSPLLCNTTSPSLQYKPVYCNTKFFSPAFSCNTLESVVIQFYPTYRTLYCNTMQPLQYNFPLGCNTIQPLLAIQSQPCNIIFLSQYNWAVAQFRSAIQNIYIYIYIYIYIIFLSTQINFKNLFYPIFFNFTTCKILENYFLHLITK